MNFNNNSFVLGLILGLLIPFVAFGILYGLEQASGKDFQDRTIALIALVFNLIPFNYFNRKKRVQSMRGMILPTIIFAFVWVFYYGRSLI